MFPAGPTAPGSSGKGGFRDTAGPFSSNSRFTGVWLCPMPAFCCLIRQPKRRGTLPSSKNTSHFPIPATPRQHGDAWGGGGPPRSPKILQCTDSSNASVSMETRGAEEWCRGTPVYLTSTNSPVVTMAAWRRATWRIDAVHFPYVHWPMTLLEHRCTCQEGRRRETPAAHSSTNQAVHGCINRASTLRKPGGAKLHRPGGAQLDALRGAPL